MTGPWRPQSIYNEGAGAIADAFHNQAAYCRANDAPITARVVAALGALVERGTPGRLLERVRQWSGPPIADALPLRVAGGLHALHLAGREPALAPIYRGVPADDIAVIAAVVANHEDELLPWLDGPPQTNEAGRSAGFIHAMLWLAGQGLPPRFQCLEIGSSAGINLMLGRYRYDLGGVAAGPDDAVMRFAPEWRGPPPPDCPIEILSTRGCDVAPVDLTDPAQALRLTAYVWPEHTVRFERIAAAVAAAQADPPDLVHSRAADFIEAELARPQPAGTTRVVMHSIVWQYVPRAEQARVHAAIARAGALAAPDRPLAWVALESNRTMHAHELTVQYWPGGAGRVLLGRAHAHGAWVERLDPPRPSQWPDQESSSAASSAG